VKYVFCEGQYTSKPQSLSPPLAQDFAENEKVLQVMISIPPESHAANLLLYYYFFRIISMACSIQSFESNKTMSGFIP